MANPSSSLSDILRARLRVPALQSETTPKFGPGPQPIPASGISANPAFDLNDYTQQEPPAAAPAQGDGIRGAIRRFIEGFSAGGDPAAFKTPYANTVSAGLVQGLSGAGEQMRRQDDRDLKMALERAKADPRAKVRETLLTEGARQAVQEPYRKAEEARAQAGRMALESLRSGNARSRALEAATRRAKELGASVADIAKLYDQADEELMYQGLFPGTPGFDQARESRVNELADRFRRLGADRLNEVPKPPAPAVDPSNPAGLRPPKRP